MKQKILLVLMNKYSEKGAVLPLILGLGLVMTLAGMTMIVRSSGEQLTASAQKGTNKALGAAEAGITRYQALILKQSPMATYPECVDYGGDDTCDDTGTTRSWANASAIPDFVSCTGIVSSISESADTKWRDVSATDPSLGQYRLVSYSYNGTPGETPGTGTLVVEGRVNQQGSGETATETVGTSTTQLEVDIPVAPGPTFIAGLRLTEDQPTDMGNDTVKGNIVFTACPPATPGYEANVTGDGNKVLADAEPMPDTPALPASYRTLKTDAEVWSSFPKSGDTPDANGYYHYLVPRVVNPTGSSEITVQTGAKIVFYVQGNINLSGNPDINKNPSNTAANLQMYGNTYTNAAKTTTKYGCPSLASGYSYDAVLGSTGDTGCPTLKAHFNGTGTMKTFVHAPEATASVNGGGDTGGNFIGGLWVKDWDSSSSNSKIKVDASGSYADYLGLQGLDGKPLVSQASSWKRQQR